MSKSVFVTVGTTEFDLLIETICKLENLTQLKELGYSKMILQIGRGEFVPNINQTPDGMSIEYFRFKDSILEIIKSADLIISHAGAGTCLEVLRAGKKLLTVVNENLMDNHQFELARDFHKDGYLIYCTCVELNENLRKIDEIQLKKYPEGNAVKFVNFLNKFMGYE